MVWSGSLKRQVDKEERDRVRWGAQAEEGWCEHSKHCVGRRCFYKALTSVLQLENFTPNKAPTLLFSALRAPSCQSRPILLLRAPPRPYSRIHSGMLLRSLQR